MTESGERFPDRQREPILFGDALRGTGSTALEPHMVSSTASVGIVCTVAHTSE